MNQFLKVFLLWLAVIGIVLVMYGVRQAVTGGRPRPHPLVARYELVFTRTLASAVGGQILGLLTLYTLRLINPIPRRITWPMFLIGTAVGLTLGVIPRYSLNTSRIGLDVLVFTGHAALLMAFVGIVFAGFLWNLAPDLFVLEVLLIAFACSLIRPDFAGGPDLAAVPRPLDGIVWSAGGAAAGLFLLFGAQRIADRVRGAETFGLGIVKTAAALGAFLGPVRLLAALVLTAVLSAFGVKSLDLGRTWGRETGTKIVDVSSLMAISGIVVFFVMP